MQINRNYRSRYRRRSRWPLILLLIALAGSLIYALVSTGMLTMKQGRAEVSLSPRNPFKPTLPSPTPTRTALSYLAEAEDLYKAGKLTAAGQAYARGTELEPNNDEAYQWQAWLSILRGRPNEAVPLARKAVALKPSAMNLGILAMALDWTEQYDEAMDTALKAMDKDPLSAEAHAFLAEVYADKNNWFRAAEEAQSAVKLNPNSPIAQRNQGYVLERQGRYKDAIAAYEKAAALAPYLGYIYISAGNTYLAEGDYENALAEFQKAADANPDTPAGYDALGHASLVAGDPDRAIAVLKKAIEMDPTYGPAHAHLGGVYYARLNYEAAIESFQRAVDLGVRSEEYLYEFGLCYLYLDDCKNATIWLKKALEINPDSKPARDGLQLCEKG
jgi:tetratricopeptide (TPR) repeat protein